jgi:multimeric flavodoxin WrbA
MNVVVLAGSPKGSESVTAEYVRYLAARRPDDTFNFFYPAQAYRKYERHPEALTEVLDAVAAADLVLWAFPLYFLLVSSGYKRFIEMLFERDRSDGDGGSAFRDRYAAALSTSIHFYDHTAHNYIHGVCDDLGMRYLDAFPAEMHDLLSAETREQLERWFAGIEGRIRRGDRPARRYPPLDATTPAAATPAAATSVPAPTAAVFSDAAPRITIVTDAASPNIAAMVGRFRHSYPSAEVVDLSTLQFGHCLGCLKCGFDNRCAYEGTKDEFVEMLNSRVLPADALVFALTMRDRYFTSLWQRYLERTFVYTHQPRLEGKQIAFLVAGPLGGNENAREILLSYAEVMRGHVVDIATDETPRGIDRDIDQLAASLADALEANVHPPVSFRGIAGLRLFRDEIFGGLRFVFQADDAYYRTRGIYDFPHRRRGRRVQAAIMKALTTIPGMRDEIRNRLQSEMVKPFRKVVQAAETVHQSIAEGTIPTLPSPGARRTTARSRFPIPEKRR